MAVRFFDPLFFDPLFFDTGEEEVVDPPVEPVEPIRRGIPLNQYKNRKTLFEIRYGHRRTS